MRFSVLLPSYKEERVHSLCEKVLNERVEGFKLDRIVVVAYPDAEVPESDKISLINERDRRGKYYALMRGLSDIDSEIVVMLSADLDMEEGFLQNLLKHFNHDGVGMVVGRPMADKNSDLYYLSKVIWNLHHFLSLRNPKGTEICAFRNVLDKFPKVSADEVFIEYRIKESGLLLVYEPKAIGYTKTPESLGYLFSQRKRSFVGHLHIKEEYDFSTSTIDPRLVLRVLMKYVKVRFSENPEEMIRLPVVVLIEILARFLGAIEYYLMGKVPYKWDK